MVERAASSSETNGSTLNGVATGDERPSAVLEGSRANSGNGFAAEDTSTPTPTPSTTLIGRGGGGGGAGAGGGTTRFSLFRWFKRAGNRDSIDTEKRRRTQVARVHEDQDNGRRKSISSSAESVETFYSTTTVRSFAFHTGTLGRCNGLSLDILRQAAEVGPFAAGASKLVVGNKENEPADVVAYTLPSNVHSRRRDITARYSLQPTTTFNSCGNLPTPEARLGGSLRRLDERVRVGTCEGTTRRRVHVKGKRRAPEPPRVEVDVRQASRNSNRRKRRAPRPPERAAEKVVGCGSSVGADLLAESSGASGSTIVANGGMDVERPKDADEGQSISNDTLVLQGGVLLSKREIREGQRSLAKESCAVNIASADLLTAPREASCQNFVVGTIGAAMPRPWYKRSVFEHSRDSGPSRRGDVVLRGPTTTSTIEIKEECIGSGASSAASYSMDASLSRLSFFHRGEQRQADDRKKESKRKSGLSILTNISELDKEAAAIVQEEQARARASMLLKSSRLADAFDKRNDVSEDIVQDMVTSAIETSSPRRGTRALISKFNAISNITKVTVNANFFARGGREQHHGSKLERDVVRNATRFDQDDWREQQSRFDAQQIGAGQEVRRAEKDISKYFLPQHRGSRIKDEAPGESSRKTSQGSVISSKKENEGLATETSSRISFLQSQLAANRMNDLATTSSAARTDVAVPVIEERIKLRQEAAAAVAAAGKRAEKEKPNCEVSRKYLFTRPDVSATTKNEDLATPAAEKEQRRETENLEVMQREFSDIFDEIDKQLRTKEFKLIERRGRVSSARANDIRQKFREEEAEISSKVSKVLDILVEAEKGGRSRTNAQPQRSILIEDNLAPTNSDAWSKSRKTKSPILNRIEDPTTADLKEMLKEMKHSLPKRSKPKKVATDEAETPGKINADKDSPMVLRKTSHLATRLISTKLETNSGQNDYEPDKQKVSSSAQTSGNVRRLNEPSALSDRPSTSGWRQQEDLIFKTSSKAASSSGLVKNTFQLIRPRDFAEIEATKTTRGPYKENTYANVIQQSLYANANVPPPSPKERRDASRAKDDVAEKEEKGPTKNSSLDEHRDAVGEERFADVEEEGSSAAKNMNTLAINRLLRKLEAAIASGHHQQAAGLAKELARLKIHCSVIRQRSARLKDQSIEVNMYIEDKLAHQGPIPLQLPTRMTVAELKAKVYTEFEIPTNVQRWIIGKNLADDDAATIDELQAVDGSPVFLYLVAPELHAEANVQTEKPEEAKEVPKAINDERHATPRIEILHTIEENQEAPQDEQMKEIEEKDTPDEIKMERYEELISLENCDIIPNSEPIECPICFVTYGPREGVILRDCLHMFCKTCLANTVLYCEEAEVKCPYRDAEYTCESTLQEREIKALVEPEVYQQHLAKSIAQAESNAGNNAFHCKTPDCPGWCIYDDDVNNFLCPVCGVNNCLTCQVVHTGKNCKQYQQELRLSKETDQESRRTAAMLEEMVDRGEALACPTCAVVLMKKWGCDWLRCSMCKTEICWVTRGPRWGPGGKGDTSGGCRCGENGIKCHPRCNYCH